MGVDIGTYRGRIGTFKFAFGDDVVTVNCYINFSRGLKTISVVTFIGVLFLLASTDTWSIQKEHATAILTTNLQQPGSVWFMDMLLLMAGIEPNPGPILCATAILATNLQQPGSVWFMDMLLLMAGIEPNPGPILCDKILSMLMVVVVCLAMFYVMTYTDTSQSSKVCTVCVALLTFAAIYIQRRMNNTSAFGQRLNAEGEKTLPKEQDGIHVDEHNETENESKHNTTKTDNRSTSQPEETYKNISDEQISDETANGSKDNATETVQNVKDQGSVLMYERMNTEEKSIHEPKEINVTDFDKQLPYETDNGSKDNPTDTDTAQDQGSFSTSQRRINAEDESSPKPKEKDVMNEDEHLPSEMDNCSKDNTNETANGATYQGSLSSSQIQVNAENEKAPLPKETDTNNYDEKLPNETENCSKDNPTDTAARDVKDQGSVLIHERMNTEENSPHELKEIKVINADEQLPYETESDSKGHTTDTEDENEGKLFFNTLQKLGLFDKFPGKISRRDIMEADPHELKEQKKQCNSFFDIPWLFLKRLISVHSECRDITITEDESSEINTEFENNMCFISELSDESQDVSPLDVINVVFQCLDPFMKQIFFKKSYLCKLAVPFLYKQWETNESYKSIISVWPLRSLAIENRVSEIESEIQSKEVDILQLQTHVVAFSRFGRPRYSKSKLINSLLTNQNCETFFNIDCPSGMAQRYLSNGQIEMFWLPAIEDKKDRFNDNVTFLNMRGDVNQHFERDVLSFTANSIDVFVVIIDAETILTEKDKVKTILTNFSSVILIIANPLRPKAVNSIQSFQNEVVSSNSGMNLRILSTHKGVIEQNVVDMVSSILKHIKSQLKGNKTQSYQQRLSAAKLAKIETDENDEICQKGKNDADSLVYQMRKEGSPKSWKQVLTPVHSKFSKKLGKKMKKREREKGFAEGDIIDKKIKAIRETQLQSVTETVKLFIDILIKNENSQLALNYFLCWLNFHIESEKRLILPKLMYENRCALEKLKILTNKDIQVDSDIAKQKTVITDLEGKIDAASFTVEHFFREIGHIYEAISELQSSTTELGLPQLKDMAKLIGRLVADGHQLEVIDGESFYMPYLWTKSVLQEVDTCIGSGKVMTLSVLGLQSSGKSTLMNTMFGSQFSTRTGRCTRGIHVQLVPVNIARLEDVPSPFNYVLVVDTEGLRSPELSHTQHKHDNELATVITGIGDITMLNVMGENTSEIKDILQVIVHAFLRLKMTNPKLDINKSCAFIHQNVADTSASENMISGLSKLMQTLDEMTKESARSEGISDITHFNQVIEFDIYSQVWYLKNLWQGNPPMAKVNNEYSERVVDIKCQILNKALRMKDKSYKSLNDIVDQAHSLWKGVLNEDFVFSFRNCLEIKAYMETEKIVQDQLWRIESFIRDELIKITQSKFASCYEKGDLQKVKNTLIDELNEVLAVEKDNTEKNIKTFFEGNKYKDITIQWKTDQQIRIDTLCRTLKEVIRQQIEKSQKQRSVEIVTASSNAAHEEELRKQSIVVAKKYQGKEISNTEKDELFNDIWQSFMAKVDSTTATETSRTPMKTVFQRCLINIFQKNHPVIKDVLIQSEDLSPIPNLEKLEGSFAHIGILDKDISLSFFQKGKDLLGGTDTMEHITSRVNQIFEKVDDMIEQLCQVNDEITEMAINKLMHELDASLREILTVNSKNNFKIPFYAKIYVHVSRFAHPVFEKHNEDYFRTQDTAARLELYKQQQRISFDAHLNNRLSEDLVANLFSNVIEGFAKQCTLERLPNKITDDLHSRLPSVKNRLTVELCTDLLEKNNFQDFIRYIHAPKEYASIWVTERANLYLFAEEYKVYSKTADELLEMIFNAVKKILEVLEKDCFEGEPATIETWIGKFKLLIQRENFSIPAEHFRNLKEEIIYIQNLEYLTKKTLANLTSSLEIMKKEFSTHGRGYVKWVNSNPIERIIKKIWGCPKQCPFCGEPCAKNEDHAGSVHYSIQHRPSCCKGSYQSVSKKAALESCEFEIQSDMTHTCGVFGYVCNKGTRENCSLGIHNYKDYKRFLPKWDIAPTSNMHDSSKFWMWFVAKYKQELHKKYGYKVDNIPTSWNDITKQQAKESLMKTYSA